MVVISFSSFKGYVPKHYTIYAVLMPYGRVIGENQILFYGDVFQQINGHLTNRNVFPFHQHLQVYSAIPHHLLLARCLSIWFRSSFLYHAHKILIFSESVFLSM